MERPDLPVGLPADIEPKKMKARLWFEALRERICATFEQIEQELTGPQSSWSPGHFEKTPWERDEGRGGGGTMSMMRGPRRAPRGFFRNGRETMRIADR